MNNIERGGVAVTGLSFVLTGAAVVVHLDYAALVAGLMTLFFALRLGEARGIRMVLDLQEDPLDDWAEARPVEATKDPTGDEFQTGETSGDGPGVALPEMTEPPETDVSKRRDPDEDPRR